MNRFPAMLALVISGCSGSVQDAPAPPEEGNATRFLTDTGNAGDSGRYARVLESRPFEFPADHASHDEYQTEWWYFTGNLETEGGRHFGFELTFFRFALSPEAPARSSEWGTSQAWMGHLAVTDTEGAEFIAVERFSRQALGLAGSEASPFGVWLEDWSARGEGPSIPPLTLRARADRIALELELDGDKPPVSHGDNGVDPKGPEPGNASHYYSLTRLEASGTLRIDASEFDVRGSAWMDREWSTSSLSPELAGWDWFGLQLADGRELMYYRLRTEDGGSSPFSGGSLVEADGERIGLSVDDVALTPLEYWTSPETSARYPVSWRVSLPARDMTLIVEPYLPQQELNLTVRYWEGAVRVTGMQGRTDLSGRGYAELTGY